MRRTINRHERDTLWRDLAEFVLALDYDDVLRDLNDGNGAEAKALAWRLRSGMRLLDDLGWDKYDLRDEYELTMPEDDLERLLRWNAGQAEGALANEIGDLNRTNFHRHDMSDEEWAEHLKDTRRLIDHDLDVRTVCFSVIGEVA